MKCVIEHFQRDLKSRWDEFSKCDKDHLFGLACLSDPSTKDMNWYGEDTVYLEETKKKFVLEVYKVAGIDSDALKLLAAGRVRVNRANVPDVSSFAKLNANNKSNSASASAKTNHVSNSFLQKIMGGKRV